MEPDSSSPASICLTVPPIFPSIPSLRSSFSVSNLLRFSLAVTLLHSPFRQLFCLSESPPSLSSSLSGPSVFQGHVRGVEEHVGVIVVVIAEVSQVSLCVAHCPGVVLSDSSPVTQPWLQSQLENRHTHTQFEIKLAKFEKIFFFCPSVPTKLMFYTLKNSLLSSDKCENAV